MTAAEARAGAVVRGPDGNAWPVPSRIDQGDLYVDVSLKREILVGDTDDGVAAFAEFKNSEDHSDAVDREADNYPSKDPKVSRLMGVIFGNDITPRLKVELLMMDGVAIYEIDLEPIMPGYVLTVPCRLVPGS